MAHCPKCERALKASYKDTPYCSLQCFRGDLYNRLQEDRKIKQKALEQKQLEAEFEAHPERYNSPQPIIVKTDAEVKMDAAFEQLKEKIRREHPPTPEERIADAFKHLQKEANGQ